MFLLIFILFVLIVFVYTDAVVFNIYSCKGTSQNIPQLEPKPFIENLSSL